MHAGDFSEWWVDSPCAPIVVPARRGLPDRRQCADER
jgi:hypothetical protein